MGMMGGVQGGWEIKGRKKWDNCNSIVNKIYLKNKHNITNKMKHKNHMIISIDVEKAFDKVHHPFMIKTFSKVEVEGVYLTRVKALYEKLTDNIIINRQKL